MNQSTNASQLPPRPPQPYRRQPPSREGSTDEQVVAEASKEKEKELEFTFVANISYAILFSTVMVVLILLFLTFPHPNQWRPFDITGDEDTEDTLSIKPEPTTYSEVGGWRQASRQTQIFLNSSVCNIDRRFSQELSPVEFERTYRHKRPVLVSFEHGSKDWTDPEQWTRQDLMQKYSAWEIASGKSDDIVRNGGSGNEISSFAEYVNKIMDNRDGTNEPMYVFDRLFYKDSSLPSTIRVPAYFEVKDELDDSIFFLGASESGVSFHKHADAWNGVVFGRKRWFLYPPDKTPPGGVWPGYSSLDWFKNVYPLLDEDDKPLECVQEAGEILYIPESFYHGTLNIGDTIAVGIQKKEASTEIEKLFYEVKEFEYVPETLPADMKNQMHQKSVDYFRRLHSLLPENTEVLNRLGYAIFNTNEDVENAIKITQKALDIDPHFVVAVLNIAKYYQHLEQNELAEHYYLKAKEMNPKSWQVYAEYGDFLADLGDSEDAARIYEVGTKLQPQMIPFWLRLAEQQENNGDEKAASESRQQAIKIQRGEV
ncbi:uncharacterized protein [Ptychodera flava]